MRFASYSEPPSGPCRVGVVSADGQSVTRLNLPDAEAARGVLAVVDLASQGQDIQALMGETSPVSAVQFLAPVPRPRRNIFCVGRNYQAHAKELSGSVFKASPADTASWPIVFTKVPECVVGPTDPVYLPGADISEQIDYEAELALIIGTGGKNI